MATRKTRDSDCCSVNFLKYVLHIFNIVFLLAGGAVMTVAIWTIIDRHHYISLLTNLTYVLTTYFLLTAGSLAVGVAILGCCGVWRESRPMLLIYTFLLLIIFLLEATVGILSYIYADHVENELKQNLNQTFIESYSIDEARTRAIDRMHQEYKCCGANSFEDWKLSKWKLEKKTKNLVPDSCCKSFTLDCGERDHPSNIPYTGCVHKMASQIRHHLYILGSVGLGVCAIQVFGMILACCLFTKLRDILD